MITSAFQEFLKLRLEIVVYYSIFSKRSQLQLQYYEKLHVGKRWGRQFPGSPVRPGESPRH